MYLAYTLILFPNFSILSPFKHIEVIIYNKNTACSTNTRLPSFYLQFINFIKSYIKKGHNSKIISFRVISLVMKLHLVMMSKYSKFGVTVGSMGYIKVSTNNNGDIIDNDLSDHNSSTSSSKQTR